MGLFSYRALDPTAGSGASAHFVRGTVTAESPRQARDDLRARGLRVRSIEEVRDTGRRGGWRRWLSRGRPHEGRVVAFCRELATLLSAGITLLDALDAIARQHTGAFHDSLLLLRDRITSGAGLAEAMRRQPEVFDDLSVNMVRVGERSGTLDQVLEQLASFKARSWQLKNRIGTALIYPGIVTVAGVGVTIFLMTFVVPHLLAALTATGQTLPLTTRIVKAASDALVHQWWVGLIALALAAGGVAAAMRRPEVRFAWHRLQLKLPLLGDLIRKQTVVRIAITLAALTRSGVEFVEAVRIVRQTMPNLVFRAALKQCEQAVGAGRDIAAALEASDVFPSTVVQIVAVGQASGRLDQMLERLAADYDQQVQTATQRLIAALEPALIVLLASFIGVIVMSVILPYLQASRVL